ncbi:16S rRNA (cytidine(1402)-2'-O)-methyltransferase [Metamycoplasma buccale]|uniref:16S rRNA (cytidine(1402)-2'-O)-methyltransferase n=1 Tax=Metamycoplasma buccale TaxID=55602 RepID=UPI00398EBA52
MESKLFIVGTPIGNLDDITLRAMKTLNEVDIILCENCRNSQKLLNHYKIFDKKLISYHNFNEHEISPKIISYLKENKNIALITDAGMPCISDPGFEIIRLAKLENISIEVIGGPTAFTHALIKANQSNKFTFLGFLKDRSIARQNELKKLSYGTYVTYVSPHKLISTLEDLKIIFNDDINLYLIKEMTKIHETSYEGKPSDILKILPKQIKGEFTLVFTISLKKKEKINKYKN